MGGVCGRDDDYDSRSSGSQDSRDLHASGRKKAWKFQWFSKSWRDFGEDEDKILKRAFMAGFPNAKFNIRGQQYTYDFVEMEQSNDSTSKTRRIRPPKGWVSPSKPLVPAGPTTVVTVKKGDAGKTITVPHPLVKGAFIKCDVPKKAKPGQAMLVPAPKEAAVDAQGRPFGQSSGGIGAGGVALGVGALAVGAGAAVAGAVLGDHIIEHGVDATVDAIGDGLEDLGDAIADTADGVIDAAPDALEDVGDFVIDAGEFFVDAGEDAADFVMDLF
jgi:hypothetical protein